MDRPDVRTSARKITIRASESDVEDGETKSEHSDRTFDIDEATAQALEDWFAQQMGEQLKWSDALVDSGRAFTMENGDALWLEYVTVYTSVLAQLKARAAVKLDDYLRTGIVAA